jgi:hypothetical protein
MEVQASQAIAAKVESLGYEVIQVDGRGGIGMQANVRAGQDNVPFRDGNGKPRAVWVLSGLTMKDGTPRSYACKTMIQLKEAMTKGHKIIPAEFLVAPKDAKAAEKRNEGLVKLMPVATIDEEAEAALATYNDPVEVPGVTTSKSAKKRKG